MEVNIFWFRRDLRLRDNTGLNKALKAGLPVIPVFIFDTNITNDLPETDKRISFIYGALLQLNNELKRKGASLLVLKGEPSEIFSQLISDYQVRNVFLNEDYEPYARSRDNKIKSILQEQSIGFHSCKDQVMFHKDEIIKPDGNPFRIFTPYSKRWIRHFEDLDTVEIETTRHSSLLETQHKFPTIDELGFRKVACPNPEPDLQDLDLANYEKTRNLPSINSSRISIYLRFGLVSIRELAGIARQQSQLFLKELIWREFFMMLLWHFPENARQPFDKRYKRFKWRFDENEFERWKTGNTGFPIVDAGMRELLETGFMHNRVRMITASFLCKHLLMDYRLGEQWFAENLLDFELSSNNGNWQWVAGCGADSSPWFRIFNPSEQQKKFDPEFEYISKWVPEFQSRNYPAPMIDHKFARDRALSFYKQQLSES